MNTATLHIEDELQVFLPRNQRSPVLHAFKGNPSVKHLIEALGIPHPEVGLIQVRGGAVDFDYLVQDGDEIRVYALPQTTKNLTGERAQIILNGEPRFILDNHLGKLAIYLRMMGFDAYYQNDYQDERLALISSQEDRILLTRDQELLKRKIVIRGYWVRKKDPRQQLLEVLERFDLSSRVKPFRRCLRCNGSLEPVSKEAILHRLEPKTRKYYHSFQICPECDQIYWKGSHYERMERFIAGILGSKNTQAT